MQRNTKKGKKSTVVNEADKLSFKVTLLLSISVLLLILNHTLPSTADKIPLIGVYCSVIFSLIGISILETILVNFLMTRGAERRSTASVETTAVVTGRDGNSIDTASDYEEYSRILRSKGERKGVNKYYPPDFDPAKHGSINGYWKTHPLRERARKLSQGILIIRFEMPYNIWCDGWVRYNAEKKKVGNYYTTPIYRMKCHLCVNYIEMQTDPATCDYVIVSGAQRKEERWDMAENEQILTTEHSEKEKLETDPMYKLDHGGKDKEKLRAAIPSLNELQEHQSGWKDDFQLNSALRRKFRTEKKVIAEEEEKDNAVRMRTGLSIPLLPEKEEDKKLASLLTFQSLDSYDDRQQTKRQQISSRSWFSSPSAAAGGAAGSLLQKLGQQGRGAAVAKALSSTTPSSHILVRRKSESSKTESANVMISRSSPDTNPAALDINPMDSHCPLKTDVNSSTDANTHSCTTETHKGSPSEEDKGFDLCSGKSLVADYSDSDSGSDV
ncbi:coiled-coil domain-containing protein 130 [Labeo rohita]|uniref:Probable splicing factor YJU2B n=1 Tax=Labeo rohita TaxID=84645 RepID=A0A498NSU8_LABRO|nr:coiled-coil domain-containing protein 130 [Labeo rohita]